MAFIYRLFAFFLVALVTLSASLGLAAETLADKLLKELGKNPSQAALLKAIKKHAPKGYKEVTPEEVLLPAEYTKILYGAKYAEFFETAQKTNPFLNPEAGALGFQNSNEVKEMVAWPYSPAQGRAFLVPSFVVPMDELQIGNVIAQKDIDPKILEQIIAKDGKGIAVRVWVHPGDVDAYEEFFTGPKGRNGQKGVPKGGYGIEWDYVGIAFNGPRSLAMIDANNPELGVIQPKVNLHQKLEGSLRIISPEKAARSVMATRLLLENTTEAASKKWGFTFMPEVIAHSLAYTVRSNVVRDLSPVVEIRGGRWVYAYSIFAPPAGGSVDDIIAFNMIKRNASKAEFEKFAKKVFSMMARPYAYNALVTGNLFEWHTANFLYKLGAGDKIADMVMLQDMEALRWHARIAIGNGFTAQSLQHMAEPFANTKYANAHGGNWDTVEAKGKEAEYQKNPFVTEEYSWRVVGTKVSESPKDQTTINNFYGFSTIVDMARAFGINVLKLRLTNEEVEMWMHEVMAEAANEVLRTELKIPKSVIPDVTPEQLKYEVAQNLIIEKGSYGEVVLRGIDKVRENVEKNGGLARVTRQIVELNDSKITREMAVPEIQEILAKEVDRLVGGTMQRSTRSAMFGNPLSLTGRNPNYYLFLPEARIIAGYDNKGWVGYVSLQHDATTGTQNLFKAIAKATGDKKVKAIQAVVCKASMGGGAKGVIERGFTFGDKPKEKLK